MSLYRTIVADPPWEVEAGRELPGLGRGFALTTEERSAAARKLPYPTLSVPEICALPVRDLADRDAHLYLWTINRYIEDAYSVARAWGFKPSTMLVWAKSTLGGGMGGAFGLSTEYVLFARRGSLRAHGRVAGNWWQWKRPYRLGRHSAKPDAFLDVVEQVSPGPYLELFARRNRLGWDSWGNEALEHVELGAPQRTASRGDR